MNGVTCSLSDGNLASLHVFSSACLENTSASNPAGNVLIRLFDAKSQPIF